jgi:hypothetical protein
MHTFEFIPTACKGDNKKFTGKLVLRHLTLEEKLDFADDTFLSADLEALNSKDMKEKGSAGLKLLKQTLKILKDHVEEVAITRVSDGVQFKSYDDLSSSEDTHAILIEAANGYMKRVQLGNTTGQK